MQSIIRYDLITGDSTREEQKESEGSVEKTLAGLSDEQPLQFLDFQ